MAEHSYEFDDFEEGGGQQSAHGMLHPDVSRWDSQQVYQWMVQRNLTGYAEKFLENEVNGKILLRLNSKTLIDELGVPPTLDAVILDEIAALDAKMCNVESWTEKDVCDWICSFGLREHVEQFQYHNVTGSLLLQLTHEDLIDDLNIRKFGQRERLLEEIALLKKQNARGGMRGFFGGKRGAAPPPSTAEELRRLEVQRVQRLRSELDGMRRKVQQLRDAEVRAKTRARQAEEEAAAMEKSLRDLEKKVAGRDDGPGALPRSSGKKEVVRGFVDQCTFKPKLNKQSLQMMKDKREDGTFLDRVTREEKRRDKERQNKIKEMARAEQDAEKEQNLRKRFMKFFRDELGFELKEGVKQEDIVRVLDNASQYNLQVTEDQKERIKTRLQGYDQFLALYNLFRIRDFVQRQDENMNRKPAGGDKDRAQDEAKKLEDAKQYLIKRFKWSRVSAEQLDNLIDNCGMFELELSEQQLQSFRGLKLDAKTRALFKALQTQEFLRRTQVDIELRERKQLQMMERLSLAAHASQDPDAVNRFLDRYHQDMQQRQERKQKLVQKVHADDPNFRECTFRPAIVSKYTAAKGEFEEEFA